MATTLTLGDLTFTGFGVPEKIPGGGDHMVAVHQLPDGVRVVDTMGADDMDLKWSGMFFNDGTTAATDQAKYLDHIRKTGEQVTLSWDIYSYTVVVSTFHWDFERYYQIPYEITCTVVEDKANPVTTEASSSADDYVQKDFVNAMGSASALNMNVPEGQIAPFSGDVSASGKTVGGGGSSSDTDITWADPSNLTPGQ